MTDPISDRAGSIRRPPAGGRWCSLWAVALIALLSLGVHRAMAEDMQSSSIIHLTGSNMNPDAHLVLLCGQDRSGRPVFENERTGAIFPISEPRQRAIAEKACGRDQLGATEAGTVKIVNDRAQPIFVGYSGGGAIDWQATSGCIPVATGAGGVKIARNSFCIATVTATNSGSRFCASLEAPPNCTEAQNDHVTLIEPTFDTSQQCSWTHQAGTCVAYDISIIPVGCTDEAWKADSCAKAGGASYNLPVELNCSGSRPIQSLPARGRSRTALQDPQQYPATAAIPMPPASATREPASTPISFRCSAGAPPRISRSAFAQAGEH